MSGVYKVATYLISFPILPKFNLISFNLAFPFPFFFPLAFPSLILPLPSLSSLFPPSFLPSSLPFFPNCLILFQGGGGKATLTTPEWVAAKFRKKELTFLEHLVPSLSLVVFESLSNKCSDRTLVVLLLDIVGNNDRQTNRPTK